MKKIEWVKAGNGILEQMENCCCHFVNKDGNQIKVYYPGRRKAPSKKSKEKSYLALPSEIYKAYQAEKRDSTKKKPCLDLSSKHTRRNCRKANEDSDGKVQSED